MIEDNELHEFKAEFIDWNPVKRSRPPSITDDPIPQVSSPDALVRWLKVYCRRFPFLVCWPPNPLSRYVVDTTTAICLTTSMQEFLIDGDRLERLDVWEVRGNELVAVPAEK
jgi:hypothetical protein